jgi:hypothetical protein
MFYLMDLSFWYCLPRGGRSPFCWNHMFPSRSAPPYRLLHVDYVGRDRTYGRALAATLRDPRLDD